MQNIKPEDINTIIKTYQYKYISLTNAKNKFGGFNKTPKDLNKKVDTIKQLLINLPNDIYYLNFRMTPTGDIFTYQFNKGNLSEQPVQAAPLILQPTQLEKFQTIDEWKKQEKTINDLQQEIAMLKLKEQFATLKEPEPEPVNPMVGFAQNILPIFTPLMEKYFDLKEREIKIKENQTINKKPVIKKIVKKFRPLPGVNDPNLPEYIKHFDTLSDGDAETELNFVATQNPDLYNYLNETFYPDETNENL